MSNLIDPLNDPPPTPPKAKPKPGTVPNPAPGGGALPKVDYGAHAEPAPAQQPDHSWVILRYAATACLILATFMCLAIVMEAWHGRHEPNPGPEPSAADYRTGVELGKKYSPAILSAYAKAADEYHANVKAKVPMDAAEKKLQDTFKAEREKAFLRDVAPALRSIVAESKEPENDAARARYAETWRGIGVGVGGGK